MSKIALLGASGATGNSIAAALRRKGLEYRVVGRNRTALEAAFGHDNLAEIVTWDPSDPESARAAVRGAGILIYLVGVPYDQFRLHPIVMRQTLEAARQEGVQNMILIGTVYPYGPPQTTPVKEDHPRQPNTFKGRMRKEQEDLLLDADAAGRIHGAILRLPDFYGPGVEKSYLDSLFRAAAKGGTADMLGPIDAPHEFLFIPDLGPVVMALADAPGAWGHVWHLAGPGVVTQRDLADRVFKMAGTKPKIRVAGKNILRLLGLFNPVMRELVEMNYLLTTPILLDDSAIHKLLGNIHKTPYDEGLWLSLDAARRLQ